MTQPNEAVIPASLKQAVEDTFRVQLSLETKVSVSVSSSAATAQAASSLDVVSLMGVSSTDYKGSFALGFPKSTFFKILESMIGEKHTDVNPQNADACSELLNIIYASARKKINEAGFNFDPAIPTTICGRDLSMPLGEFSQFINFRCETAQGEFLLVFSLRKMK